MTGPLSALRSDPWRALDALVDGPLHPGGADATATLLDRAGVDEGTRLLDVGCGAGDALRIARRRGAHAVGIDRTPRGPGVVRGDLSSLPFRDDCVDVVLGECVLCLADDLGDALGEAGRVLRTGGRLALSDVTVSGPIPDLPPPADELLCLGGRRDRATLLDRVEAAGFRVDDVRDHRAELLAMRDRLVDRVDLDRVAGALGDRGERLRAGARDLGAAVDDGRVAYVSVVATREG